MGMWSDLERETLREEWSSALTRRDYFGNLCAGYQRRERIAKLVVLISSCGALVAALAELPGAFTALLAEISAVVCTWLLVVPNRARAAECAELRSEWNRLAEGCRVIWNNMETESASASLQGIRAQSINLSKAKPECP